jgi:sugar phosphate isomerase/epimerase
MKLSFSTASFYHLPLSFSLRLAQQLGFDGVELVIGPDYLLRGERAVQRLVQQMGVRPLSLHPPMIPFGLPVPRWPRSEARTVFKAIETARAFGCELVVIHATAARREGSPFWRAYAQAMRTALVLPGPPITVGVEISQHTKRAYRDAMDDVDTVLRFVEDQGEQVGITLDTAHTAANGDDLLALYARVRPRLRNVHLSDWTIRGGKHRTHLVPGEGRAPLAEFLDTLARDGYSGLVTLEISPYHLHAWNLQQARERLAESLAFVRAHTQDDNSQTSFCKGGSIWNITQAGENTPTSR